MEQWQIDIIKDAYKRCYGLQQAVNQHNRDALLELAHQTGLRPGWLFEHRQEIYLIENQ